MRYDHAIRRCKERYGIDIDESDLEKLTHIIQNNQARLIGYMQDGRTVWKLKWKDCWLRVVIDKTFYDIITFLPKSGPVKLRPSATYRKRA